MALNGYLFTPLDIKGVVTGYSVNCTYLPSCNSIDSHQTTNSIVHNNSIDFIRLPKQLVYSE